MKNFVLLAIVFGILAGGITAYFIVDYKLSQPATQDELIKAFYDVETAAHVSPHGIRKHMTDEEADFILVDLRSQEEYETMHVAGAVSIPAYKTPDKSAYGDVERIVDSFTNLISNNPDKEIIVYCYSMPCMTGRKIGKMLADHGIYVKHLGIGWNEWRYQWNVWNHDGEKPSKVEDYIVSGPEPGEVNVSLTGEGCPLGGEFGC